MIYGFTRFGYEGALVNVEVDLRDGLPATDIVGLADSAVKETKERVKTAISNTKVSDVPLEYPNKRVLISLSPANLKKDDASFNLTIALAVLDASENRTKDNVLVMGELDLSGDIRPVRSTFAACQTALKAGINYAILPEGASVPNGMKACFVKNLREAFTFLKRREYVYSKVTETEINSDIRFKDDPQISPDEYIGGITNNLKFAMTVAVAGKHNLLSIGTIGRKENTLLYLIPQILPELNVNETQSTTRIHSIAGLLNANQNYMTTRPFRIPHHTASIEGMCGGGIHCNPGEISVAHNGVLFLDEASEFRTSVLQMLRVPIENHYITLSRAGRSTVYPANFQLVMSTQPCPCGNYGRKDKICLCSAKSIEMYWRKFSAPLLDRVEIRFDANSEEALTFEKMTLAKMRELITSAWEAQQKRGEFNGRKSFSPYVPHVLTTQETSWFENIKDWQLITDFAKGNARIEYQLLSVARTLADMNRAETISRADIELAIKLRANTIFDVLED